MRTLSFDTGLVPTTPCVKYTDVINFGRYSKSHNCVMCGLKGNIPSQNKDVCKSCDTVFWYHTKLDVVIKFCKGKNNTFEFLVIISLQPSHNSPPNQLLQAAKILLLFLNFKRNLRHQNVESVVTEEGKTISPVRIRVPNSVAVLHHTLPPRMEIQTLMLKIILLR